MSRMTVLDTVLRRMANTASLMLDPAERDAVCGDLAESRESGSQVLREVLGLVVRRRAACLLGWRPWLTLANLTIPLSVLVSLVSRRTADHTAIYLWFYVNNWDWTIIHNPGFWRELAQCAPDVLLSYLALACWSWTTGLLVGRFARRILWLNGTVFFAVVLAVGVFGIPRFFDHILVLQRARDFRNNSAVFLEGFYRQLFPLCVQLFLVVLPAWRGMIQGRRMDRFARTDQVFLLIAAATAIGTLVKHQSPLVANACMGHLATPSAAPSIDDASGDCGACRLSPDFSGSAVSPPCGLELRFRKSMKMSL